MSDQFLPRFDQNIYLEQFTLTIPGKNTFVGSKFPGNVFANVTKCHFSRSRRQHLPHLGRLVFAELESFVPQSSQWRIPLANHSLIANTHNKNSHNGGISVQTSPGASLVLSPPLSAASRVIQHHCWCSVKKIESVLSVPSYPNGGRDNT